MNLKFYPQRISLRIGLFLIKFPRIASNPQRISLRIGMSLKESLRIISEGISIDVLELSSEKKNGWGLKGWGLIGDLVK